MREGSEHRPSLDRLRVEIAGSVDPAQYQVQRSAFIQLLTELATSAAHIPAIRPESV